MWNTEMATVTLETIKTLRRRFNPRTDAEWHDAQSADYLIEEIEKYMAEVAEAESAKEIFEMVAPQIQDLGRLQGILMALVRRHDWLDKTTLDAEPRNVENLGFDFAAMYRAFIKPIMNRGKNENNEQK